MNNQLIVYLYFQLIDISELIEDNDLLPEKLRDIKNFTAKVLVFDSSYSVSILVYYDPIYYVGYFRTIYPSNKMV